METSRVVRREIEMGWAGNAHFYIRCKTSTRAKRGSAEDFSWTVPFFRKEKPSTFSPPPFFFASLVNA